MDKEKEIPFKRSDDEKTFTLKFRENTFVENVIKGLKKIIKKDFTLSFEDSYIDPEKTF